MQELWDLLISAQDNVSGIPTKFLEQKKEEIKKRQVSLIFLTLKSNKNTFANMCKLHL